MSVKIIDKDHGYAQLKIEVRKLKGRGVQVGIWGGDDAEGTSVVDYALYNEFGTRHIPSRPFLAMTYDRHKDKVHKYIEFLAGKLADGNMTGDRMLQLIGEDFMNKMKMMVRNATEWAIPIKDATAERKGSTSPLIDTGRMINAINYEVL